jgi:site-specific DNA recombinase
VDLQLSNQDNFIYYSIKISSKLDVIWGSGSFELKQRLQNLVFPEGVTFDFQNNRYRTCKSNSVFSSILGQERLLEQQISELPVLAYEKSASVARMGVEPMTSGL